MRSKLRDDCFRIEEFNMKFFEELMGFGANHAGLTINVIINGMMKDYRFFVKTGCDTPLVKDKYWNVQKQFYKEHVFFTALAKTLQNFVEKKITAECYLSKLDKICILEDLCGLGYQPSRVDFPDRAHAERAVHAFANLHASAILCQEKCGVVLEERYEDINYESLFSEDGNHPKEFLLYSLDRGLRALGDKFFTHVRADVRDAVFTKIRRRTTEILTHPKKFRKVVCQGDPYGNNILYKYSHEGEPLEAILVDFGVLRFAPPAMDLMQFLYIGVTFDFRVMYKSQIKDLYYQHLVCILSENGVDVDAVLPKCQFLESCDVYEEFAICCHTYYMYVVRLPGPYLLRMAASPDTFLSFMIWGDPKLALEAFEKEEGYRNLVTIAIEEAFRYYKHPIS